VTRPKNPNWSTRFDDTELGMLRDLAALAGVSQSAWVRGTIRAAAAAAVMGRPAAAPPKLIRNCAEWQAYFGIPPDASIRRMLEKPHGAISVAEIVFESKKS
jgi:hypothetical protein